MESEGKPLKRTMAPSGALAEAMLEKDVTGAVVVLTLASGEVRMITSGMSVQTLVYLMERGKHLVMEDIDNAR